MCENLECLCHLLTTVGKKLDTDKAKVRMSKGGFWVARSIVTDLCFVPPEQGWMDKYFQRIESLARMKELPARIRFMLLDLSELRLNNVSARGTRRFLSSLLFLYVKHCTTAGLILSTLLYPFSVLVCVFYCWLNGWFFNVCASLSVGPKEVQG